MHYYYIFAICLGVLGERFWSINGTEDSSRKAIAEARPPAEEDYAPQSASIAQLISGPSKYNESLSLDGAAKPSPVVCTSSDLRFSGSLYMNTDQTIGTARIGDTLTCLPTSSCYPLPTRIYWKILETGWTSTSDSVEFTGTGVGTCQCIAVFSSYQVTRNIRVTVYQGSSTCYSSNLQFSGSLELSSDQRLGWGRIGDTLTCNANCYPPPNRIYWRQIETGQTFDSAGLEFVGKGEANFQCIAVFNSYQISKTIYVRIGACALVANSLTLLILCAAAILLQNKKDL